MTTWSTADALEAERRYAAGLSLTLRQTAHILNLHHQRGAKKGQPDRRQVLERIADGRLQVIDTAVKQPYWTIAAHELDRYQTGGTSPTVRRIGAA
jgi:hypothetical protein